MPMAATMCPLISDALAMLPSMTSRNVEFVLTRFRLHSKNGPLRSRRESTRPTRQSSDEKRFASSE